MTTEETLDPSPATTSQEVSPPPSTPDPAAAPPQESVEELKEKLAAAETEAKRWKGRVEKATKEKSKEPVPVSEEDLDWKIANTNRVQLVKDAYDKEIQELQESGAKITPALKTKALEYAEAKLLISKPATESSDPSLPSPAVDRSGTQMPRLTEYDRAMDVKPETVKEYRDYVEGR